MKKVFLLATAILFTCFTYAQNFGIKAGYNSTISKVTFFDMGISNAVGGFYIGLFTDFELSEGFTLQPEVQYVKVSIEGSGTNLINVPFVIKYNIADNFSLQVGPQVSLLLEEKTEELNNFGLDAVLGLGYDISEKFFIDGRYILNLNNRYTGVEDFKMKYNGLQVGLGYRF